MLPIACTAAVILQSTGNAPEITRRGKITEGEPLIFLNYAYEGYPIGASHRLPNTTDVPVSQHVYGLAVDIDGDWLVDPWSEEVNALVEKFGLVRPFSLGNVPESREEWWHFELRDP